MFGWDYDGGGPAGGGSSIYSGIRRMQLRTLAVVPSDGYHGRERVVSSHLL